MLKWGYLFSLFVSTKLVISHYVHFLHYKFMSC